MRKTHALFKDGLKAGLSAVCHGLGFLLRYKGAKGNSLTPLPSGVTSVRMTLPTGHRTPKVHTQLGLSHITNRPEGARNKGCLSQQENIVGAPCFVKVNEKI